MAERTKNKRGWLRRLIREGLAEMTDNRRGWLRTDNREGLAERTDNREGLAEDRPAGHGTG